MSTQTEALRLADLLERDPSEWGGLTLGWKAAAELRRLNAQLDASKKAANELADALGNTRRERDYWHARLLAEVNKRHKMEDAV